MSSLHPVLQAADFEPMSWRVHSGCQARVRESLTLSGWAWVHERSNGEFRFSPLHVLHQSGSVVEAAAQVWDIRLYTVGWETQLARLAAYKAVHGDCNVPVRWADDPQLATWVNDQRQRKRKLNRGEPSDGMTAERAARLTSLVWNPLKAT